MPTNVRPSLSLLREESAHGRAGRPCRCASRSGAKLSAGGGARLLHAAELRGSERSFDAIPDRSYRFRRRVVAGRTGRNPIVTLCSWFSYNCALIILISRTPGDC